jgi:hypothetical protein
MRKSSLEYLVKEEFNVRLNSLNAVVMDKIESNKDLAAGKIKKLDEEVTKKIKDIEAEFKAECLRLDTHEELSMIDKGINGLDMRLNLCM